MAREAGDSFACGTQPAGKLRRKLHILFGFATKRVYIAADKFRNGHADLAATFLDLQRRPASLPLGYAVCEGQGDVARGGVKSGC